MLRLDHVVHVVRDLEAAAEELRSLGLHVAPGGNHPGWGTRNALCYFDLTYIELVAVRDAAEAAGSDFGSRVLAYQQSGDGLASAAFRTNDIIWDAVRVGAPVIPGSRRRPDGSIITWQLALPPWPWPFLIRWGEPDEVRRRDLTARGVIREQGLRLRSVGWSVADLGGAARRLEMDYGVAAGEAYLDAELGCTCRATDAGLLLCRPAAGESPAAARLAKRGEGPWLYDLTGPNPRPLTQVAGAWLRIG